MISYAAPRRKYCNIPTEYAGRTYDSKAEAARAQTLDLLKRAGEIRDWEPKPRFTLHDSKGGKLCGFTPDFLVTGKDGTHYCEDTKGHRNTGNPDWRLFDLKRRMLLAEYGLEVRVVS